MICVAGSVWARERWVSSVARQAIKNAHSSRCVRKMHTLSHPHTTHGPCTHTHTHARARARTAARTHQCVGLGIPQGDDRVVRDSEERAIGGEGAGARDRIAVETDGAAAPGGPVWCVCVCVCACACVRACDYAKLALFGLQVIYTCERTLFT